MTYGPAGNNYDKLVHRPDLAVLDEGFIGSLKTLIAQTEGETALESAVAKDTFRNPSTSGFSKKLAFDIDMPIVVDAASATIIELLRR